MNNKIVLNIAPFVGHVISETLKYYKIDTTNEEIKKVIMDICNTEKTKKLLYEVLPNVNPNDVLLKYE